MEYVYIMFVESIYVDMTQKSETKISYYIFKVMVKSMLKVTSKLKVLEDIVCARCQCGRTCKLSYG